MAGLGFKDFTVGEVLTSANVDGYLMQQTVMRFADSAGRGSALGTAPGTAVALAEGMVSYLNDTNAVEVYDGSAWNTVRGLIAVKHALFTGTQTNSTASGANFAVTDLSITHTLTKSANKLLISAFFGLAANGDGYGQVGIAVADDGTLIGTGAAAGSRPVVSGAATPADSSGATRVTQNLAVTFVYEPGDTASHTYTVRAINTGATETIYINRTEDDTDNTVNPRAASGLVIQEIAV